LKKRLLLIFILLSSIFISGCSYFTFPFDVTKVSYTTTLPSRPNTATGTVTYLDSDYAGFPVYHSDTYDLDVDRYNEVLIASRDLIRRSNIQLTTTLYQVRDVIPWGTSREMVAMSRGSGVIYDEDDLYYYAITNYHVIDPEGYEAEYEVKTFQETIYSAAEVIAANAALDLAVVRFAKAERTEIHLIDIETRVYTKFTTGEMILAVGNPLSLENNVTFGEYKNLEAIEGYDYLVIYHSATINEGSSGGALVDVDGNLLGINTWGLDESDEFSFAIPNYLVYMFLVNEGLWNN